jgi:ribose transport system ATP-binding protein
MGGFGEVLVKVNNLYKFFGSTAALKNVSLTVRQGEIHGLIGENGSGKSTLTSILAGEKKADRGEIFYKGASWSPGSMIEAQRNGISMILQETNTISGVSVAENIFAGQEKYFSKFGFISMKKIYVEADKTLKKFGMDHISAKENINKYNFEDRKLIEIARSVTDETQVLVVDETTTALSHSGRELLYKIVWKMAKENKAVIFISHDMDEILKICNVITVLRDGDIIGTLQQDEKDAKKIRYMMVGREIGDAYYREDYDTGHTGTVAAEIKNASFGHIRDFSLKLHEGEILGIGGLSGCGMHDVGRALFGLEKLGNGQVLRNGVNINTCNDAIESDIGYISKNRDTEALILMASIKDNIVLPSLKDMSGKAMFVSPKKEKLLAEEQIKSFSIKCRDSTQYTATLSGGNKQKVSFAKWLGKDTKVFIMDCPTRGVDIGVKQAMYGLISDMKKQGKSVLIISEELAELIGMCDHIMIMKDYKVAKVFERSPDLSETDIIEYMI